MKDNDQLQYFRKRLFSLLNGYSAGDTKDTSNDVSFLTEQEVVGDHEMDFAIKGIIGERQIQIREALKRIETGGFGICLDCNEDIDNERLDAIPEATLCIDCQRQKEREAQSTMNLKDNFYTDQIG